MRVIRLRGAGRAFTPGYDIDPGNVWKKPASEAAAGADDYMAPQQVADVGESRISFDRERLRQQIERWMSIWNYRKPIVAQTHGFCLSGGLDLINCCDLVVAAEGTLFGHPASRGQGIPPTIGMWAYKIGPAAVKELLFTGDLIDADKAQRIGLISDVVPADELDERAMALCQRIALLPLDMLTIHKHVVNRAVELGGGRLAALEGAEHNSIAHMSGSWDEFRRRAEEGGLRAALAWRDQPFIDGPAADHDARNR